MGKTFILDSGALSYFADRRGGIRGTLHAAFLKGAKVVVPTAVIAEATTGDHRWDANVNRELKRARLAALDEPIARAAAALRHAHRKAGAGTIDAIVVATADTRPGTHLITADPNDLKALASVRGVTQIVAVSDLS
jgi:predicted nucleic acid-binding protein